MRDLRTIDQYRDRELEAEQGLEDMARKRNGIFWMEPFGKRLFILASSGAGWDHVSVSTKERCPTWEEMKAVKEAFFHDTECVLQYLPAKKDYVDGSFPGFASRYCLHLWRPLKLEVPMPPRWMVGANNREEFEDAQRAASRYLKRNPEELHDD